MGEQRKRDILKLAREFDLIVIEDDPCVALFPSPLIWHPILMPSLLA